MKHRITMELTTEQADQIELGLDARIKYIRTMWWLSYADQREGIAECVETKRILCDARAAVVT